MRTTSKMQFAFRDNALYPGQYAWALRAIGQDLGTVFAETFEIRTESTGLVVRGRCRGESAQGGPQKALIPFVRTYTPDDIRRIDRIAISRRTGFSPRDPDIYSLGERLRTIGRMLDLKAGRLVRLRRDSNTVSFEYQDSKGETRVEEDSILSSYKHQQRYHSNRKEPWDRQRR